MLADMS